uniref:Solute carrier family 24 member 6a n=1 Tax=Salarias fasciatus TaxID=181472 RepID=A0A672J2B9_SALFA
AIYMFHALAIVCDVYFVPSLEKVSENLQLSQDVAGATFMAAGSSAPELFTSLIGVFITKGDVGVGTIVGSAVFNILVIIGICGIFAGQVREPFEQTVVIYDEKVMWWETIILISMYGIYIIIMNLLKLSSVALCFFPPITDSAAGQDSGVAMVDELLNAHPHQLTFSEASLRLLISPHFPRPKGAAAEGDRPPPAGERERGKEAGGDAGGGGGGQPKEEEEEEEQEEEEEESSPFKPFVIPDGWCARLKWLLSWPVSVLLYCTIPDCSLPRWEHWYLLTFLSSTLWIALFSYLMVWMVTIISYTLGIPEVIMGITFLAAGTSVPDCMASLIVARQGMGDMAVSNSIGSNIFDVLLGLGFPWALRTLIVSYGSVTINSKGLVYSVILLLASVTLTVLCVHLNRWRLDRRLGLCLLLLYAIFLLCAVSFERL